MAAVFCQDNQHDLSVFEMQLCTVCCKQDKAAIQYRFLEKPEVAAISAEELGNRYMFHTLKPRERDRGWRGRTLESTHSGV